MQSQLINAAKSALSEVRIRTAFPHVWLHADRAEREGSHVLFHNVRRSEDPEHVLPDAHFLKEWSTSAYNLDFESLIGQIEEER